ncbi:GFPT2 isoform 2, partial [Pongo abelii]
MCGVPTPSRPRSLSSTSPGRPQRRPRAGRRIPSAGRPPRLSPPRPPRTGEATPPRPAARPVAPAASVPQAGPARPPRDPKGTWSLEGLVPCYRLFARGRGSHCPSLGPKLREGARGGERGRACDSRGGPALSVPRGCGAVGRAAAARSAHLQFFTLLAGPPPLAGREPGTSAGTKGIFAYMNYRVPRTRKEIFETLIKGLQRLEYRGYDSAGLAIDGNNHEVKERHIQLVKKRGKVKALDEELYKQDSMDLKVEFETHFGIAHTRWATHGVPSAVNSHPQRSDKGNEFVVIHNGIITNYKDLRKFLESKGYEFESETDTETIAKLIKYVFDNRETEDITFSTLVERVIQQLEGAFALVFKSIHYPGEAVATRRGSPLLIGVRSKYKLSTEQIPILYRTCTLENVKNICKTRMKRLDSSACLHAVGNKAVEFFFASDA